MADRHEVSTICVFCGSSPGLNAQYAEAASRMGRVLAAKRIALVYGGGRVGLMGAIADSVLAAGGNVTGVIPSALVEKELAHTGLTDLRIVETMHERKALMASLADAFIALPGGLGTFEELFEVLTWGQLGIHRKPSGLLNVAGFFDPLLAFIDHAVKERFIPPEHRQFILEETDPGRLIELLQNYTPPTVEKWLDREET